LRILGIDLGERRIGLAVSDSLGITAQGLKTIQIQKPEDRYTKIMEIIKENKVERLVFGLPKNMNGSLGPQARKVQEYAQKLGQLTNLPIDFEDERLSTVRAEQVLLEADQSRAKRKKSIDRLSAVIILQSYLDRQSLQKKRNYDE
jgi:putative Holliday junction resolvase